MRAHCRASHELLLLLLQRDGYFRLFCYSAALSLVRAVSSILPEKNKLEISRGFFKNFYAYFYKQTNQKRLYEEMVYPRNVN